ncbi:17_t:CDS:1 [Paraglomus occultum]|uniref:17_t:CDS:1 n=1 Tax=Paraglomus occultum TaxID=144539 RepID=A0A9N9GBX0_9GLOM|nr:17_t:CDS:1 [Paraglomus occultum]
MSSYCNKRPADIPGFSHIKGDVVLIHGYKGSKLYNTVSKRTVWVNLHTPLNPYSKETIDLPLHITGNEEDRIVAAKIMRKIAHYKFYDAIVTHLKAIQNSRKLSNDEKSFRLHTFAYDWRRENDASVETFTDYLKDIYKNNGNRPIYVIAHSNGGLITLTTLHRHPHLFAGCIFAGTPFHGAPGIFWELKYGAPVLFNKRLQDKAAVFSLRTAYGFLPPAAPFVDSITKEDIEIDHYDVEAWLNNDWTDVIHEETSRHLQLGTKEERIAYLKRSLETAKKFREGLKYKGPNFKYPPICTIVSGEHLATGKYPVERSMDGKLKILYYQRVPVAGDGVVPFESAKLPEGIPHDIVLSKETHSTLLEDLEAVGKAVEKVFSK